VSVQPLFKIGCTSPSTRSHIQYNNQTKLCALIATAFRVPASAGFLKQTNTQLQLELSVLGFSIQPPPTNNSDNNKNPTVRTCLYPHCRAYHIDQIDLGNVIGRSLIYPFLSPVRGRMFIVSSVRKNQKLRMERNVKASMTTCSFNTGSFAKLD